MPGCGCERRLASSHQPVFRKDLAMTSSTRSPLSRIRAIALVTLVVIGAGAPAAAFAEPDTNIQKPGHVSVQ
jgi:hypothetical protein